MGSSLPTSANERHSIASFPTRVIARRPQTQRLHQAQHPQRPQLAQRPQHAQRSVNASHTTPKRWNRPAPVKAEMGRVTPRSSPHTFSHRTMPPPSPYGGTRLDPSALQGTAGGSPLRDREAFNVIEDRGKVPHMISITPRKKRIDELWSINPVSHVNREGTASDQKVRPSRRGHEHRHVATGSWFYDHDDDMGGPEAQASRPKRRVPSTGDWMAWDSSKQLDEVPAAKAMVQRPPSNELLRHNLRTASSTMLLTERSASDAAPRRRTAAEALTWGFDERGNSTSRQGTPRSASSRAPTPRPSRELDDSCRSYEDRLAVGPRNVSSARLCSSVRSASSRASSVDFSRSPSPACAPIERTVRIQPGEVAPAVDRGRRTVGIARDSPRALFRSASAPATPHVVPPFGTSQHFGGESLRSGKRLVVKEPDIKVTSPGSLAPPPRVMPPYGISHG